MSHHPVSRAPKGLPFFLAVVLAVFVVALFTHAYFVSLAVVLIAGVGYVIYVMGESSDLPGTSGDDDKNVPT